MTNVSNQTELQAAIAAQETDIVVTANFDITTVQTIFYAATVSGGDGGPYTLTKGSGFNSSVFVVTNRGELTLRNMILDGAKDSHSEDPANESLITVNGGSLLLDTGTVLQNNYARAGGGVSISADGAVSNLFMRGNAVIRDNTASNGGGIYCNFSMTGNAVEISGNAVIENNAASDGGGISFNSTVNNMLYIRDDVKITGNTATADGGGIDAPNGEVFLAGNVEISGNTAANGGGVALSGSGITVEDGVTIKDNTATRKGGGVYINSNESEVSVHGLIQGNTSPKTGGVFIENMAQGSLDFSSARFLENVSNGAEGDGGGLNYSREIGEPSTLAITLNDTVFDGNQSYRNGGGMQIESYVSSTVNLSVNGCQFLNNVATNLGGGMDIYMPEDSTVSVQNSTFSKNTARGGAGVDISQIFSGQLTVTFRNVTISNNKATSGAGGLYLGSGNQAVTLSGVTIEGNSTEGQGGGIESSYGSGTLTIDNDSKFIANHAGIEGGGLNVYASKTVTLENVAFIQNTARSGNDCFCLGELRIGSDVKLPSGIYLIDRNSVPEIFGNLSADSIVQLEQGYYLSPLPPGTPIVVATGDSALSPQDAAAFRVPNTEGFIGWEIRLSDDNAQILVAPEVYAIAYENTRGAENPNPPNYTVVTPTIALIDLPSSSADRFLGWFDAQEGGNRVREIPQGSTGSRALYAQWENVVHILNYLGNDAGGPPARGIPESVTVVHGQSLSLSSVTPTRTGFRFTSWNTLADGSGAVYFPGQTIGPIVSDVDLHAQWLALPPKYFRICFKPNACCAGEVCGMPPEMELREYQSAHIPYICPCRPCYCFIGWNTRADGCGMGYVPGQSFSIDRDLVLFAQWR